MTEEVDMKASKVERVPGIVHTIAKNRIDLNNFTEEDVTIPDIAWGLGRTLRYGGHIREDWTVAHHSVVMSYLVPEEYALEALLHDAAEAYIGDIIYPVKALFPEVEAFENRLLHTIMDAFEVPHKVDSEGRYKKSPVIKNADNKLLEHECHSMDRGGYFIQEVENAWLKAIDEHPAYWFAAQYAFLERFDALTGSNHFTDLGITKELTDLWFTK